MLGSSSWLGKRAANPIPAPISVPPTQEFNGNDGPWSSFPIEIGSPPQKVKVLISTASSQTWAINPQGCIHSDPANCSTSRGGFFQPNDSSTWHQNQDAAGGLYPLVLETYLNVSGNDTNGLYGYDTVALGDQGSGGLRLNQQVIASLATKEFYLGLFGLSPNPLALPETDTRIPSFLSNLNQSRLIPSLSWSYTAGNQYRPGPVYGSLILGGYDPSRFEPNNISYTFNHTNSLDMMVNIGGIILTTDDFVTTISTDNQSIAVAIDSTTPYIVLPLNVCKEFEASFGIVWDENVQAYLVNDTLHSTLLENNTSVVFNLGNTSTVPGQGYNISLPYSAFDLTAQAPLLRNSGRYFPLKRASNESQYVLGRTFLQEAYVIANYEHNNFSVSQCNWESGAEPQIVAIHPPGYRPPQPSHKLSPGAIAGIVVGAVVALVIVALMGIMLWRRRRLKKRKKPKQMNIAPVEMDSPEKDPCMVSPSDIHKDHPQSPELDSAVHKGHELPGSPYSEHTPMANEQRYELDATERRSRTLSTPISPLSERSDATRLHQRQTSDPTSLARERSDATRLHKRELSDPVSLLSERRDEGTGTL